jgi:hypothetical protein
VPALADGMVGRRDGWQTGWLVGRRDGWLADGIVGRLVVSCERYK